MIAVVFLIGIFIGGCVVALVSQSEKLNRQQREIDRLREQQNIDF